MTYVAIFTLFALLTTLSAWALVRSMNRQHRRTSGVREREETRVLDDMESRLEAVRARSRGNTESLSRELDRIRKGSHDAQ